LHGAFFILAKKSVRGCWQATRGAQNREYNMIKILTMDDTILIIKPLCELFTQLKNTKFLEPISIGAST